MVFARQLASGEGQKALKLRATIVRKLTSTLASDFPRAMHE
jgi:hypothetical protein